MVEAERGDRSAADALFAALYAELHRMAMRELWRQGDIVSISATTLLHEAYLVRLVVRATDVNTQP
jgi:hypothetical protein